VRAVLLCSLLWLGTGFAHAAPPDTPTALPALKAVPSLDVERYMGTWYEMAKYPNFFQRRCARQTQAQYSLLPGGQVRVLNRCRTEDGEWIEAEGLARQTGGAASARLQVRFAPQWLSFLPLVWGDYWVVALDPQYQWALVSEPRREYLWVLARTPALPEATWLSLHGQLASMGFDVQRLQPTPQ
jgi:apolipoprotein D and lipocalin family protein